MTTDRIFATMTLETAVFFDRIVAFVIHPVALLTSSPMMRRYETLFLMLAYSKEYTLSCSSVSSLYISFLILFYCASVYRFCLPSVLSALNISIILFKLP